VKRRQFITLVGGAAAWPMAASAQQPAMPMIGFLDPRPADGMTERVRGFRQGLRESGYVEGENVAIEYRWADNQPDRVPALAAELARRQVTVIVASGGSEFAAKTAAPTIPIVFVAGYDPVKSGLIASLSRPGGNATGISFLATELLPKRLELLLELVPSAARIAVLVNPSNTVIAETQAKDVEAAGRSKGMQILILNASSSRAIEAAFATLVRERSDALFIGSDPFFNSRRVQLVHLASHHRIPTAYGNRDYPDIGGLMSYGTNVPDAYRQAGLYTGRILKGAKPADLPVVQASKFELVINAPIARMLGLTVPDKLLATADEVIE
jgi:putative ABC transport system substrate-binding protein